MLSQVYTIRDRVAEDCGPLFTARNDGVALRQFHAITKESDQPQDFDLLCIGGYDSEHAKLHVLDIPRQVVQMTEVELSPEVVK